MSRFAKFRRIAIAEMRPYVPGEALPSSVSINDADKANGSPKLGDYIARNPNNHSEQWLVAAQYAADNFMPIEVVGNPHIGQHLDNTFYIATGVGAVEERKYLRGSDGTWHKQMGDQLGTYFDTKPEAEAAFKKWCFVYCDVEPDAADASASEATAVQSDASDAPSKSSVVANIKSLIKEYGGQTEQFGESRVYSNWACLAGDSGDEKRHDDARHEAIHKAQLLYEKICGLLDNI